MITKEVRFDMRLISADAMARYMKHRGYSVRRLAADVERELVRRESRFKTRKPDRTSCKPATIGHLRSGYRDYATTDVATVIEEVLDAPRGSLFVAEVSTVQRERKRVA